MPRDAKNILRRAWSICTDAAEWPFVEEYQFHATRRWRFDWADPVRMIAVEIEGVTYSTVGRHQRAGGYEGDCEKYNAAVMLGWRVLRYSPRMIERDPTGVIAQILDVAEMRIT